MIGVELTGWFGALAVLLAFALLTNRRVTAFGRTYVILNVAGSAGLAVNGVAHSAWPSVVLNLLWLAIAALAVRGARGQDAATLNTY
ncbi:MAG: hypothetical protein DLM58_01025 [Pseudonocardiales bacterium]|nr:MAG: hypothetical protein DLM58_01025 [Pseudonocardiales bacterium]